MMLEKKTPVAIVGLGKIARDQHLPAIAASDSLRSAEARTFSLSLFN